MIPKEKGAVSNLFVATSREFKPSMSGAYFGANAKVKESSAAALNVEKRDQLEKWTVQELTKRGFL